ncbi:MAG: hypothetical protein VXY65_08565, partial [Actinomycetota bacterium]|nr:hypothetical protein [Actinomycetota bacterium]
LARQRVADEGDEVDLAVDGRSGRDIVDDVFRAAGFGEIIERRVPGTGLSVMSATRDGEHVVVEQGGPFSRERAGLLNGEALWRLLGRAAVISGAGERVIVVTAALPSPKSESDLALRAVGPRVLFDVIDIHDVAARERLKAYGNGQHTPVEGFWTAEQIATY